MPRVLLFGPARQAAGSSTTVVEATTVAEILDALCIRYGAAFAELLAVSKVWVDGEAAEASDRVEEDSEVSILPPVSGGAR